MNRLLKDDAIGTLSVRSREGRKGLAQMLARLFDLWELDRADQAALLGLSTNNRATLARYRRGEPLANNRDLLDRVGHLLGIHKSLRILYPYDREMVYAWISRPNKDFGGLDPIAIIKNEGFLGLAKVRRYLEFRRGH